MESRSILFFCHPIVRRGLTYAGVSRLTSRAGLPSRLSDGDGGVGHATHQVGRLLQGAVRGPKQVLRYLSRYTHRVPSQPPPHAADEDGVAFRWKDYRIDVQTARRRCGSARTSSSGRFLLHVLPRGFHRIRHYGLFANANRAENIATARALLDADSACRRPTTAARHHSGRAACAALPMPALRARISSSRSSRRLRAKVAADPKHDRHIMSQTACERRRFPVPLRWLHAGGDLSRPNHANQRADRPLIRSTPPPRSPSRALQAPLHTLSRSPAPASRPPS